MLLPVAIFTTEIQRGASSSSLPICFCCWCFNLSPFVAVFLEEGNYSTFPLCLYNQCNCRLLITASLVAASQSLAPPVSVYASLSRLFPFPPVTACLRALFSVSVAFLFHQSKNMCREAASLTPKGFQTAEWLTYPQNRGREDYDGGRGTGGGGYRGL